MKRLLLGVLVCVLMAGCGVGIEDTPQPITDTASSETGPTPSVDSSPDSATPTLTTTTTRTTTTTPLVPRRSPPPHSTEPSVTR